MGWGFWDSGFWVWGLEVPGLGFGALGFRVEGLRLRGLGLKLFEFRVGGLGPGVPGFGFRGLGCNYTIPIGSLVVPFWDDLIGTYRILNMNHERELLRSLWALAKVSRLGRGSFRRSLCPSDPGASTN